MTESTFRASTVASLFCNGYVDDAVFDRCTFDSLRCNLSFDTWLYTDPALVAAAARRLLHGNHVVSALEVGRHDDGELSEGEEEDEDFTELDDWGNEGADEDAQDDEDAEDYAEE